MNFSEALTAIKAGKQAYRDGWDSQGTYVFLVPGSTFTVDRPPLLGIYLKGTKIDYHAHIDMRTADGYVVPWVSSQDDLLAEDWVIL